VRFHLLSVLTIGLVLAGLTPVSACGGLFCQNIPVDQQAERIIFTINGDGTVTAYVQINYTGSAPDFSWVLPVPSVPELDVAEMASFDELSNLTAPVFVPPLMPDCALQRMPVLAMAAQPETDDGVTVLASGEVGPFSYDVITSPDPQAMISWLRKNNYRITPEMEPLVAVYNAEGMVFLAMKLQPEMGVQDIQPIVLTYDSTRPMIPLRLTAVAANPNMTVLTWIFADAQTFPVNYARPTIDDEDIRGTFLTFDGTNYLQLLDATIDLYDGRAFVTEYAMPTSDLRALRPSDPLIRLLSEKFAYLTRHIGRISPEEMTVDPVFDVNPDLPDVSNVHDLSGADAEVFWGCKDVPVEIEYNPDVVPEGFK
jgi:hypothetical protein